jgi:hypothetical protein
MREQCILDDIEREIRRHLVFDSAQKYDATALWIAGTYFLGHPDIKVFSAFPMLGFMSPEPDSGKSRALEVAQALSYNSIGAGNYTTALLLNKIDNSNPDYRTLCLDEMDTVFAHGKDNSDLIRLFNLGYERGKFIGRMSRFNNEGIETPAYCPKVFAGLKIAKIPGPTKTRTIVIGMRPKSEDQKVERHLDTVALEKLKASILEWSQKTDVLAALRDIDFQGDAGFLNNRNEQIWQPLLAIAKITSEQWYHRALSAAKSFTTNEPTERNLTHAILLAAYRVFRGGQHPEKIHTADLLFDLWDNGVPKWIDANHLADCLSGYEIKPRQMKINNLNRNGYDWHAFLDSFSTYISKRETEEIEKELGLIPPTVDKVEVVDGRTQYW